ncbi:hypothetical protein GN244_ATG19123 [Phytophthora infestans]|uniref:Uncharacterized protein n=1 Tax=Phytophthora infestans TaxID=4787 RepID=A0A833RNW8_PHYIN|nr:hypothetical protein GN244_ATG19123 [Phytophthora infestans]
MFERSSRPISDVYRMFLELPQKYSEMNMPISEFGIFSSILKDRFNFVDENAYGVSYLLDPRYGGEGMDDDTRNSAADFICNWHGPEHENTAAIELMR